jgi:hypothetical protein
MPIPPSWDGPYHSTFPPVPTQLSFQDSIQLMYQLLQHLLPETPNTQVTLLSTWDRSSLSG